MASESDHDQDALTYEAAQARVQTLGQPDKIHWSGNVAFRDKPYRQLHHQNGLIGVFRVRLLEASQLKRSYWSALALGPVKHLGLSKAHGAVSSFCSMSLEKEEKPLNPSQPNVNEHLAVAAAAAAAAASGNNHNHHHHHHHHNEDKKLPARVTTRLSSNVLSSPTVSANNDPVWDNCQFEFPLAKGGADGLRVVLNVRVEEEATGVENFIPGIPSGGDGRLLGLGKLDLTELCLGESESGQALPGIRDAWIPISMPPKDEILEEDAHAIHEGVASLANNNNNHAKQAASARKDPPKPPPPSSPDSKPKAKTTADGGKGETDNGNGITGNVHVLVSYQPIGLEPRPNDVVAMEVFARRNQITSSCRPLLPPLQPMLVLDRQGSYLLCQYQLPSTSISGNSTLRNNHGRACVRIHRNAVFVIERQNFVDAAKNLALLPVDVYTSTPLGQASIRVVGPVVMAGRELMMPALLSFKLAWVATRTTVLAGVSGMHALGSTFVHEGSSSLTHSAYQRQRNGSAVATVQARAAATNSETTHVSGRNVATAKYVQL